MRISITIILLLSLAACSTTENHFGGNDLMFGSYYKGDGLGVNISIQLNPDGTYTSDWNGCLGSYGNSEGSWQANSEYLLFSPSEEDGMMAGELKRMKIVEYKGEKGFVPESELAEHKKTLIEFGQSFYVYTLQKP